ncbi:MAG: ferredoxin, partial [Rhodopseudomonas sp.]|uniref:ferredoxin n=1 Tax=Rhodopseudomonas sp. TaxID=1078 RepID=UPI001845C4DE
VYSLKYKDETGAEKKMDVPMTFADFAATEGRFGKQFKKAPPDTWNDNMLQLAEFLELDQDERDGKFPYIWAVDQKNRLTRLIVSEELVLASEERLNFWLQLKDLTGSAQAGASDDLAATIRAELIDKITASLGMSLAGAASAPAATGSAPAAAGGHEPVWIETPECTACDECTTIAPKVFAYNDQKLAIVVNPQGAKYADIVKAAEKCTAGCLHPGTPWNANEPGLEKLIARGAKFN